MSKNPKLREFKLKQLMKIRDLKKQLLEKYPDQSKRIEDLVNMLIAKLQDLRTFTLCNYLFTLYRISREFKEFEQLIPDPQELESLLKRDRDQ